MSLKQPLLGMLFLAAAGCGHKQLASTQADRLKERPLTGSAILLVDPDVMLFEKNSSGGLDLRVDWTLQAERTVLKALVDQLGARRLDLVAYDLPPRGSDREHADLQVLKLHAAASQAIVTHHFDSEGRLPSKQGKLDWSLGPGVRRFKAPRGVDYVFLVCIRDTHSGVDGKKGGPFGIGRPEPGQQWGFASLLERETGNIVWCSRLTQPVGDLRDEEPAAKAVKALMAGFPL